MESQVISSDVKTVRKGKPIDTLEYIYLNGARQYVQIRGKNTHNPIIFYIHGGPGIPEMPLINHYNRDLENHFTLVYWEQRGAGKSYSKNIPYNSYTIHQYVKDAYDLIRSVMNRFRHEKIYIMGHSWGTIVATRLAVHYPELFHAYIGIGQMVDLKRGEELSFKFVLQKAFEENKNRAINQLHKINKPPFLTIERNPAWYKQLKTARKWLVHFGGLIYRKNVGRRMLKLFIVSREYSWMDMLRIARGNVVSIQRMWPEIMKVKLINEATEFKIPVYFFQGKYDYNCPTELVKEYLEKIYAPEKALIVFNNSAHAPNFEESERFNSMMVEIGEKLKYGRQDLD